MSGTQISCKLTSPTYKEKFLLRDIIRISVLEIQQDEFRKVFPSMNGVKTIIKKPISINELLKQITPSLQLSAIARAVPGEHILVVFETHRVLVEQALECLKIGLLEKEEDISCW